METALIALAPWNGGEEGGPPRAGRRLASVQDLAELDRTYWQNWSERKLKETQRLLDELENEPAYRELRASLSRVAMRLVEFHGYAERGNSARMISLLGTIRDEGTRARRVACAL